MKRTTATKRIKTHLNDYRKRLAEDKYAELRTYMNRTGTQCPLCLVVSGCCFACIRWPRSTQSRCTLPHPCNRFVYHINSLDSVRAKLRWIDKLEPELDRWAAKETA